MTGRCVTLGVGGAVTAPPPGGTVVLCIGNHLLSDEGVGVHAAKAIYERGLPPEVTLIEGGTDGFKLMNVIVEADRIIVVDCVKGGAEPGSLYRFDIDDAPTSFSGVKTSVHQIGILEVIHMSELISGRTPRTTFIGCEPESLAMSMELSPTVAAKLPRIVELVFEELAKDDAVQS